MAAEKEISCGKGHQNFIKDRLTRHFLLIFPVWIELALSKNRGCFSKLSLDNFLVYSIITVLLAAKLNTALFAIYLTFR